MRLLTYVAAMAAVAATALAAPPAERTRSYLRIDGVPGASNDPNHLGWFDVASWTPGPPTSDGRATARIHLVGAPSPDIAAAVAGRKSLHEALLQDVQPDGRLVRSVSFWSFAITGPTPAKGPPATYAVTLQAQHAVCDDYGPPPPGGGPCAVLKAGQKP
ncbi:MAG TPA: hypothetical protein VGF50_08540 [Caulobacteraceae bacterium]|jgi:hypothetical protein